MPNRDTRSTSEGTLAHDMCQEKVLGYLNDITAAARASRTRKLNKLRKDPLYTAEMERCTDEYFEYIKEQMLSYPVQPSACVESEVSLKEWVPEGFGRADFILFCRDTLHVVDFKYGEHHSVSAKDNPQMKLYALGAYEKYKMFYSPSRIKLAIFQPRMKEAPDEWETTFPELLEWAESILKPAATLAFAGKGDLCKGDHCKFCRAKGGCKEFSKDCISAAEDFAALDAPKDPPLLTDEEIGRALTIAEPFAAWLSAVKKYALGAILQGRGIPGWKAVRSLGNRTFSDESAAFTALKANGVAEEMLYERKPLTPTQVEKLIGKKEYLRLVDAFVIRPERDPALAAESDPRPAYSPIEEDFQKLN